MQDYAIQKSSRKCFVSDQPFQPGDHCVTAIVQKGSELVRRDYTEANWPGPNADTIGWWRSKVPAKRSTRTAFAPNSVLVQTLETLLETPGKSAIAYLLALLLVRRRVLVDEADAEQDSSLATLLTLRFPSEDRLLMVPIDIVDMAKTEEYQTQLVELLHVDT